MRRTTAPEWILLLSGILTFGIILAGLAQNFLGAM
jgi:hypothetical protein